MTGSKILHLLLNLNVAFVLSWIDELPYHSHLLNQTTHPFILFMSEDLSNQLSSNSEDTVVLMNKSENILLCDFEVKPMMKSGIIEIAGSKTCISHCDKYSKEFLNGDLPYLDASVVMGDRSAILSLLPDVTNGQTSLQELFSELYLAGNGMIKVDDSGQKIQRISNEVVQSVHIEFGTDENVLTFGGLKPDILLLSQSASLPATRLFQEIGRYVGGGVTHSSCGYCARSPHSVNPSLFIVMYIEEDMPFISNTLQSIQDMPYDKHNIELLVLCLTGNVDVLSWKPEGFADYKLLTQEFQDEDHDIKFNFLELFSKSKADYFVYLDASVSLTANAIPQLLQYQKPIISPMLKRNDGSAWSNFWGSFTDTWDYARSSDYDNIFTGTVKAVLPVACLRNMYIVQRVLALDMIQWNVYDNHLQPDISFCKTLFEQRVPMFLSNMQDYGSLRVQSPLLDMKLAVEHENEWRRKYIAKSTLKKEDFTMPCHNVFHHSGVYTPAFGRDLIKALDTVGGIWKRYPTWHDRPGFHIRDSVYNETLTNVVLNLTVDVVSELFPLYTPKRQLFDSWIIEVEGEGMLERTTRHDSAAAYHVVIPLSNTGSDGGFWFGGYNCKVLDLRSGDLLVFPGFITHQKQDLHTEAGMRHYLELAFDLPHY